MPNVRWVTGDFSRHHSPEDWASAVVGVDAVVNAVGIIRETRGQSFAALHSAAPRALFAAARAAGARRIVQISALGTEGDASEPYFVAKREADRLVDEYGGVVLRPSFVWGPGDLSMRFFRMLAALPVTPVVGDGQYRVMPVHVHDLARAVVSAVEGGPGGTWDVVGADAVTFDELLDVLRARLGRRGRGVRLHLPTAVVSVLARVTDVVGVGPINSSELSMLLRGSSADLRPFVARFGFAPRGVRQGFADEPGPGQDRVVAELDLLAPVLRVTVGFIWLATPFVTWFVWPRAESLALLAPTGVTGAAAGWLIDLACVFEVGLGVATLAGWRLGLLGVVQIALVVCFSVILTVSSPELWGHPFGPLTKNIPLVGAILALMVTRKIRDRS